MQWCKVELQHVNVNHFYVVFNPIGSFQFSQTVQNKLHNIIDFYTMLVQMARVSFRVSYFTPLPRGPQNGVYSSLSMNVVFWEVPFAEYGLKANQIDLKVSFSFEYITFMGFRYICGEKVLCTSSK